MQSIALYTAAITQSPIFACVRWTLCNHAWKITRTVNCSAEVQTTITGRKHVYYTCFKRGTPKGDSKHKQHAYNINHSKSGRECQQNEGIVQNHLHVLLKLHRAAASYYRVHFP